MRLPCMLQSFITYAIMRLLPLCIFVNAVWKICEQMLHK